MVFHISIVQRPDQTPEKVGVPLAAYKLTSLHTQSKKVYMIGNCVHSTVSLEIKQSCCDPNGMCIIWWGPCFGEAAG